MNYGDNILTSEDSAGDTFSTPYTESQIKSDYRLFMLGNMLGKYRFLCSV